MKLKSTAPFHLASSVLLGMGCFEMIEIALKEAYACMSMKAFLLTTKFPQSDSDTLFLEINLRLRKWLVVGAYKPPEQSKFVFLES